MMGLAPCRKTKGPELCLSAVGGHIQEPGRGPPPEPNHAGTLTWDRQPPELGEISFCCVSYPEYSIPL